MNTLKTSTLPDVANGLLAAAIDQALADAHHDIVERPKNKSPRKITIELLLRPTDSGEDTVDAVGVQFNVDMKKPKFSIKRNMASFPRTKSLGFESDTNKVTHAKNQRTLPVDGGEDEEGE